LKQNQGASFFKPPVLMIVQFCGLSGAGKSTLAYLVQQSLRAEGLPVEILDGDEYRKTLCRDLGFSREDRHQNILRMAFVAGKLSQYGIISIISAINPYQRTRNEVSNRYPQVKTIHIDCPIATLIQRDTKDLYRKALLPDDHPDKVKNLTGINDPFEAPSSPDLYINTSASSKEACALQIFRFIQESLKAAPSVATIL
jgi:adenylylsulfate kinase